VKKRKNAHDAIVGVQHENLVELLTFEEIL